jgi:hypothetical protein
VRQDDVTGKGRKWDSGASGGPGGDGVEGKSVQRGDKINERVESREGVGSEGGGDLYSRAKRTISHDT